ncbi:hypothetical protein OIU76_019421 [Salix suchowensis]|nr:hypothetical protein OIU76_019421 [Salix suchowensis]
MAGAVAGGSFLSALLQVLFDRMASREFVDFFKGQRLSDELLRRLKTTMRTINRLLDDDEEKQIINRDLQVWLDDLKDAVYEADDFLDEIAYEGLRSEIETCPQTDNIAMFRNGLPSCSPVNRRIMNMKVELEKILDRLEDLVEQKDVLGSGEKIGEKHETATTSLVDESAVFGRNNDKDDIVTLLLSDNAYGRSLGVIPIVGMCGVGKTTLAQLVYNDSRVQEWFDLKTWKMKEVGDEYFSDLVSRSFFQQSSSHPSCFVMHDLINDFAKLVAGEFCNTLDDAKGLKLAKKTRHLSYVRAKHGNLKEFEGTYERKVLRTFLLMEQSWELDQNENGAIHDLLPTLTRLRCKDLVELPNSIGKLKHLQHLDLSATSIRKLPNCVIGLCNLETLILRQCKDLTVLPTNMASLMNLHHLDTRETNLKEMPLQMVNLKNLLDIQ